MRPNFSGTWRANLQRSKLLGPAPKALLVKINHSEQELVVEMLITKPDDSEERRLFKGLNSGQEVANYANGVEVSSCSLWEGTELLLGTRSTSLRKINSVSPVWCALKTALYM